MPTNNIQQNPTLATDSLPAEISPVQAIALGALLAGKTKTEAARQAGVDRTTIHEWLKTDKHFIAFYNGCRRELAEGIKANLLLLGPKAVVTLRRLMTRRTVPDGVKLGAAVAVLRLVEDAEVGPDDPEAIATQIAAAEQGAKLARLRANLGRG